MMDHKDKSIQEKNPYYISSLPFWAGMICSQIWLVGIIASHNLYNSLLAFLFMVAWLIFTNIAFNRYKALKSQMREKKR